MLVEFAGRDNDIVGWAASATLPEQPCDPWLVSSSVADLQEISHSPLFSFASHTWSHPNLAMLRDDELGIELSRPLAWLRETLGSVLPWVAYPYGLSSPQVAQSASNAGFAGGLLVSGGLWSRRPPDVFALPRCSVPAGLSLDGFRLRLAGMFPR